jgi:hypothetical protein
MWEGIRAGFKQFLARQKASSAVSARKRELRDAEKHLQSMLDALYQRKYPPNRFFAPISEVTNEIERLLIIDMRAWRRLGDPYMSADGTLVEHTLMRDYQETFYKGSLGSPFKPLTMGARAKEGILAHDGRTEPVTVGYEVLLTVKITNNIDDGVDVSCTAQELIDPHNECFDIFSGNYAAPSLMYMKLGGNPCDQLLARLRARFPQQKPSPQEWAQLPETRSDAAVIAAEDNIRAAAERLAAAEAARKSLG